MASTLKISKTARTLAVIGLATLALPLGATLASADSISVPATVRDFSLSHPDFQAFTRSATGIVESTLGRDGKPLVGDSKENKQVPVIFKDGVYFGD